MLNSLLLLYHFYLPDYAAIHPVDYFDNFMEEYLDKNHYSGATVGVARGSMLVHSKGYGTTTRGTTMDPTTLLPISSVSKTITAVAILRLVQGGHLHLADKVFGPDGILSSLSPFPSQDVADHRLYRITIEHLLHHTAGWSQQKPPLYDPLMNQVYLSRGHSVLNITQEMGLENEPTRKDVIQFMMGRKLDHLPGSTYEYSNFGFCVLGQIIEEVSWMSYEEYVREYVLTPLGMWQTQLKSKEINPVDDVYGLAFHDGDISLTGYHHIANPSLNLIDSPLGWHSTIYDTMRLVTGLAEGSLLTKQSLGYLLTPPSSPMFEHQETWPGMGVRVSNTGVWWQVADPHDNEVIIYHQPPVSFLTKESDLDSLSWVLIMSSNNRKNLRSTFHEMISSINWPLRNQFLDDCGMAIHDVANDDHAILMNFKITESQFPAYINALARGNFHPTWISTFTIHTETFVSVVSRHIPNHRQATTLAGLVSSDLKEEVTTLSSQGMQLSFINSYNSESHKGHIMQTAILSDTDRTLSSGVHVTLEHYLHALDKHKEEGYIPVVQSTSCRHSKQMLSYVFEKLNVSNWNSYTNLTLDQLDGVVRSNAMLDRTLYYLDSYVCGGELFFSAVFIEEALHMWHFQSSQTEVELQDAAKTYKRLGYFPKIVTGYENNYEAHFAVLWVKL